MSKPSEPVRGPAKLEYRNEIARMRRQIPAQQREIRMLQRAGVSTASAELLLSRMRAKVGDAKLIRKLGDVPSDLSAL